MTKAKPTEKQGIKAVIALQAAVGITETEAAARAGWRAMSASERTTTMEVFRLMTTVKKKESKKRVKSHG